MKPVIHTRGDARSDGRLFWGRSTFGSEVWLHPVAFGLRAASMREKASAYRQQLNGRPARVPVRPSEVMRERDLPVGFVDALGRVFLGYRNGKRERGFWGSAEDLQRKREAVRAAVFATNERERLARDMARGYCKWCPKTKLPKVEQPRLSAEERDERLKASRRKWKLRERAEIKADPVRRAMHRCGMRLRHFVKGRASADAAGVGCTREFFRLWMSQQFVAGMSWDNYGSVWSVDHILPQSWFKADEHARRYLMNHYTNLRPLFALENGARCDRVTREEFAFALQRVPDEWRDTVFDLARKAPPLLEKQERYVPPTFDPACFTC